MVRMSMPCTANCIGRPRRGLDGHLCERCLGEGVLPAHNAGPSTSGHLPEVAPFTGQPTVEPEAWSGLVEHWRTQDAERSIRSEGLTSIADALYGEAWRQPKPKPMPLLWQDEGDQA